MKQPLHILFLPSWYPVKADDIGGSFFREQALALHKKSHKVGVVAPAVIRSLKDVSGIITKPYGLRIEDDQGIQTYRWHMVNFTPRFNKINGRRGLNIGEKLFKEYIKNNGLPDIIHVQSLVIAGPLALLISKKYEIPYVVTEHSSIFATGNIDKRNIQIFKKTIKASQINIAVSNKFVELLNEIFSVKDWQYLPNIVNDSFLNAQLKCNPDNHFEFISICSLDRNKRIDILIQSFSKAFKGNERVKLKIGGDGPEKNNLVNLMYEEGLSKQVTFLGSLEREQVKKEMASSDAFVLSSEYETFGVVIIEAMALGKPVVATRCGGPESIVIPLVGYLVEKNSIDALAEGMTNLYENRDRYSAEDIREYCKNNFSEDVVVNKLVNIYLTALNKSIYDI